MAHATDRIFQQIQAKIDSGDYAPGQRIPSERVLEQQYQVSRVTINRALTQLRASGVIESRRGSGSYVISHEKDEAEAGLVKVITPGGRVRGDLYIASGQETTCRELKRFGKNMISSFYYSQEDYLEELASLNSRDLFGAILWHYPSPQTDEKLRELKAKNFRFVLLDHECESVRADTVTADNILGSRLMVRHLIAMGHRDIVYLTKSLGNYTSLETRQVGFIQEMIANRLPITHESIYELEDEGEAALEKAVAEILNFNRRPTAFFVSNDLIAFDVYSILKKGRLSVPKEISLAGFDDIDSSKHFEVPLTTVSQNFSEMGRVAASIICQSPKERNPDLHYQVKIKPDLIVRESTGKVTSQVQEKGFTLIELLVVISIISLLISILLPALQMARKSSRSVACLTNQKQIGVTMQLYANDNKDVLPYGRDPSGGWPAYIKPYVPSRPVSLIGAGTVSLPTIVFCPEQQFHTARSYVVGTDYVVNHWVLGEHMGGGSDNKSVRLSDVIAPQKYMLLADGAPVTSPLDPYWVFYLEHITNTAKVGPIHLGNVNMLFLDWHAGTMKFPDGMSYVQNTYKSGLHELR